MSKDCKKCLGCYFLTFKKIKCDIAVLEDYYIYCDLHDYGCHIDEFRTERCKDYITWEEYKKEEPKLTICIYIIVIITFSMIILPYMLFN